MMQDIIGDRGEAIFYLLITELCDRTEPYFRPFFLGQRYPTVDYIVELVDPPHGKPFFFAQVKTTTLGYTTGRTQRRLRINVSKEDVNRLVAIPAPTYVVGIDDPERKGYIVSVNEPRPRIQGLTTRFPLDCKNLALLQEEVATFWQNRTSRFSSRFAE